MHNVNRGVGYQFSAFSIVPKMSEIAPSQVSLETRFTKSIAISAPFLASPMDTVISLVLARKLTASGLPVIIPTTSGQSVKILDELICLESTPAGKIGLLVSPKLEDAVRFIEKYIDKVSFIALDTLHSSPHEHFRSMEYLCHRYVQLDVISGNVVFGADAISLYNCGAAAIRVGFNSASINNGNEMFGCGRTQVSSIYDCSKALLDRRIPIIADGSIASMRDAAIALALGASSVMMGKMFAALHESAAPYSTDTHLKKRYFGMSRLGMIDDDLIPETLFKEIDVSGYFEEVLKKWSQTLKISISRGGSPNIEHFHENVVLERMG